MSRVAVTYADYAALPDDGKRYEVLDGELCEMPSPGTRHQRVIANLFRLMDAHVRGRRLGEVLLSPLDIILSDISIVQPDLVFIAHDRAARVSRRGIEGAPTLALEVLSPSSVSRDRVRKMDLYARHRVPFVWVADPEARTLEAFVLGEDRYAAASRLDATSPATLPPFTELRIAPADVWPGPARDEG